MHFSAETGIITLRQKMSAAGVSLQYGVMPLSRTGTGRLLRK